jgi:hypothetical protein
MQIVGTSTMSHDVGHGGRDRTIRASLGSSPRDIEHPVNLL